MQTEIKTNRTSAAPTTRPARLPLDSENPAPMPTDVIIAELSEQLRQANENIAKSIERQRQLRLDLLKAQERSLVALRRSQSHGNVTIDE